MSSLIQQLKFKKPEAVRAVLIGFNSIEDAGSCVSDVISKGIVPAGMEIMDKPLIIATENYAKAGYPRDVEALLIVEIDGTASEVEAMIQKVLDIAKMNKASYNKASNSDEERMKFWKGEKLPFRLVELSLQTIFVWTGLSQEIN